jgi:hypothetical protein
MRALQVSFSGAEVLNLARRGREKQVCWRTFDGGKAASGMTNASGASGQILQEGAGTDKLPGNAAGGGVDGMARRCYKFWLCLALGKSYCPVFT